MKNNKLFVGGLSYSTSEDTLLEEFQKYGVVKSIRIVTDRNTGKSLGFGFVTMGNGEQAKKAIDNLSDKVFDGRRIGVKPHLNPRPEM